MKDITLLNQLVSFMCRHIINEFKMIPLVTTKLQFPIMHYLEVKQMNYARLLVCNRLKLSGAKKQNQPSNFWL